MKYTPMLNDNHPTVYTIYLCIFVGLGLATLISVPMHITTITFTLCIALILGTIFILFDGKMSDRQERKCKTKKDKGG